MVDKIKLLTKLYTDAASPVGFSSKDKLWKEARRRNAVITKEDVDNFLMGQRAYTLHKQPRYKFKRLKTVTSGLHVDWQADLAVMDKVAAKNDKFKYMLICCDVCSRKVMAAPVLSKRPFNMIHAFDKIFSDVGYKPWRIITDGGLEFNAKLMLDYFNKNDIIKHQTFSHPVIHAGIAERAIRTVKGRIYRYFTNNITHRWIDILPQILKGVNNSVCRSTGFTPNSYTFENATERLAKVEWDNKQSLTSKLIAVGTKVRVAKVKTAFKKGYLPNFSDTIYTVSKTFALKRPVTYEVTADDGTVQNGKFYSHELCPVIQNSETVYRVEIIRSRKGKNGEKEYYVSWIGYADENNCWVREKDLLG